MPRFSHGDIIERTIILSIQCIKEISKEIIKETNYNRNYIYKQFGTSISSLWANITEANVAISDKECKRILGIALREWNEALYWIRVFDEWLDKKYFNKFTWELIEICKIINTIMKNIK